MRSIIDWKRLLLAAPLLLAAGVGVYVVAARGGAADAPRASLVETPPAAAAEVGVQEGELARDFVAKAPDGTPVRLSELRGRPTLINFWATWCGSCLAELPEFKAFQEEIGTDRLNVLAINLGEDASTAQGFIDELQAHGFRFAVDPTLVVADAYAVYGLPTSVFLDADGVVRGIYAGHLRRQELEAFVAAAASGQTAEAPETRIRLVTTVARDHLLEVRDAGDGRADLRSKSLRCDDSYCAAIVLNDLESASGIVAIERHTDEDPPRVLVAYDRDALDIEGVARMLAEALDAFGDPLYERELEIVYR